MVRCAGGDASGELGGEAPGDVSARALSGSTHFLLSVDGLERGFRWIFLFAADIIEETMSRVDTSFPEKLFRSDKLMIALISLR